ncbi:MAG: hypothetical protein ACT4PT_00940, partial [Methanobacteriota archaeon]
MAALRMRLHRFPGPVLGTCQVMPFGRLANFGGFTDGDRACFLAEEMGAKEVLLAGFDFENPGPSSNPIVKKRKLYWAQRLLKEIQVPVHMI